MAHIKSSSDLQRSISSIYDLCSRTGEPVYITRNGEASLVVMDAESFEDMLDRQHELEHELQVYKQIMQSELDRLSGNTVSWDDVKRERSALRDSVA